ncbi:hypothetical protein BGW42_005765 [Actinomortierella wolfii]|nr:hypothetical protein BGW42_005765 [Actinomortierella wolfii]
MSLSRYSGHAGVANALDLSPMQYLRPQNLANSWTWITKRAVATAAAAKKKVQKATGKDKKTPAQHIKEEEVPLDFQSAGFTMGQWELAGLTGVSAMHGILIPNTNKVVFLEKVEKSVNARLSDDPTKFSYTVEYDLEDNTFRPLHTKTNMFCSAGGYRPDGTIVSLGGAEAQSDIVEGWNSVRFLASCRGDKKSRCDWDTRNNIVLKAGRWYPTVETLADGRLFILGGATRGASMNSEEISVPSWELYPPLPDNPTHFDFLEKTLPNNLYPMVHLLPDGNLFIFANTQSVIFSTTTWKIIKTLPDIPGQPRNYPLSGGSVLLPLRPENNYEPEIMVCGGSTQFSFRGVGQDTCARIKPLSDNPRWVFENMPLGRMMPDVTLLHDGSVLILSGAQRGAAGYGRAKWPTLQPVIYKPWLPVGEGDEKYPTTEDLQIDIVEENIKKKRNKPSPRFILQRPSVIPRLYHSIALPTIDGRVMVAGSNPNANTLVEAEFPVEYRLEMFSPGYLFSETPRPYLSGKNTIERTIKRPPALTVQQLQAANKSPEQGVGDGDLTENLIHYNTVFNLEVEFYGGRMTEDQVVTKVGSHSRNATAPVVPPRVQVNLLNGGFVTHSTHMSHRVVGLEIVGYVPSPKPGQQKDILKVKGPRNGALVPPGWYQMTLVENGVPSEGIWVRVAAADK